MKKKIIISFLLLVATFGFCASTMPYARKCTKCQERAKTDKTCFPSIGIMHRDFETSHKIINDKICTLYKCQYGCQVWIPLDN